MTEKQTTTIDKPKSGVAWGPAAAILVSIGAYVGGQALGYFFFVFLLSAYFTIRTSPEGLGHTVEDIKFVFEMIFKQVDALIAHYAEPRVLFQFGISLSVYTITLVLLYIFLRYRRATFRATGLVKPKLQDAGYALAGFAIYLPIYIASLAVISQFIPTINIDQKQQLGFDQANTPQALLLVFVSLVVLPPLVEEILARGFLYSGLRAKLPVIYAALITSALFGAAHLQFGSGMPLLWVAAIDTFILSMVLVYMRERSGSLWPPIGLHMIKNGLAFLLVFVLRVQ